jgi:sodium transport system ATP-binding protein
VVVIDKGISAFSGDIGQFRALADNGDLRDAFLSVLHGAVQQQKQQGAA